DLLFFFSLRSRGVRSRARLLFQLHTFKFEQIFGARNWIAQRAISVVQQRTLIGAPALFFGTGAGVQVGMQLAAERIKLFFQRVKIDVQTALQPKEGEVVGIGGRLELGAMRTKMRRLLNLPQT